MAIARPERIAGAQVRPVEVNGQPGRVLLDPAGRATGVVTVDIADGLVRAVRIVVNPEKLRHL